MAKVTTSRHVYKKIHRIEEIIQSLQELEKEGVFYSENIHGSFNDLEEAFVIKLSKRMYAFNKLMGEYEDIIQYLEKFKLNSKLSVKVLYYKQLIENLLEKIAKDWKKAQNSYE